MLDLYKIKFKKIENTAGKIFSLLPLSPNQYTLLSLFFAILSFLFLLKKRIFLALFFFLFASFLDFIDGAVARYKGIATKLGAYLDTIIDRYVEGILIFGLMFLPFPQIIFPHYIWLSLILFGSVLTTYAKAAAKEKELTKQELRGGFFSRAERLISLMIVLIFCEIDKSLKISLYFLIFIAILTNFTALQRILSAICFNLSLSNQSEPKKEKK